MKIQTIIAATLIFLINTAQSTGAETVKIQCNPHKGLTLRPHHHNPNTPYYRISHDIGGTEYFKIPYVDIKIKQKKYNPYDLTRVLVMRDFKKKDYAILFKQEPLAVKRDLPRWLPYGAIKKENFEQLILNNYTDTVVFTIDQEKKESFYISQIIENNPTDFTGCWHELNPEIALHNTSEWKKQAIIILKANINTLKAHLVANIISTIILCNAFLQHTPLIFILIFIKVQLSFMQWHLSCSLLTNLTKKISL